jgi:hypothetical protein
MSTPDVMGNLLPLSTRANEIGNGAGVAEQGLICPCCPSRRAQWIPFALSLKQWQLLEAFFAPAMTSPPV